MENSNPYFSFTFCIPPPKKVYYAGRRRAYGSMNQQAQYKFLCDLMTKSIYMSHFEEIDYVFEAHQDGRLHIHGYVKVEEAYMNIQPVYLLRDNFYSINNIVNIAPKVYMGISNIQQTYFYIGFWEQYIEKHQQDIIYKSPYRIEKENAAELDVSNNVVRIEHRPITPPPEYYDTYRFKGKENNNNFIVEF